MLTVVVVVHLMIVAALIGVVLLQRSEGGGLGVGSSGGFMSSRGTANLLTRTTAFLALGFFATSLLLSWIASLDRKSGPSPLTGGPTAPISQSGGPPPIAPQGGSGGLLDTLKQQDQNQAPAAPSGPQVPRSQ
jgi:preprotein translocase subunit SecG